MGVAEIIGGIIAFIKAIPILDGWYRDILAAYLAKQEAKTLSGIIDAANLSMRAKNDDDRFKAAAAWRSALERPRVSAG